MNYTSPFASRSLSRALILVAGLTLPLAACPSDPDPTPGTGGAGGSATGGRGGSSGTGGSAGAGGSSGSGGVPGTGGTGGTRLPDAARPADGRRPDGSGGDRPRNDGGSRDTGNAAPVGGPPRPSVGCGKANPVTGNRTLATGNLTGTYIVSLPAGYNPATPYPLGFAFNGFNRTAPQCVTGDCPGFTTLNAIRVFPESFGAGWETPAAELASNIQFFADLLALVKNEYCVDQSRVFVAGVSSGGQFVEHLACRFGDQLWQATEISAYVDQGVDTNCKGTPAQLIVHGVTDAANPPGAPPRSDFGRVVSELYGRRNGCNMPPLPGLAQARMEMMAAFNARQDQIRCLDWQGCSSPVRFCISSQITYDGLTHGWPRVGGMLIQQFQGTLR